MRSFFQALARGAEQASKSMEEFAQNIETMAERVEAYKIKTEVMLGEDWYNQFRIRVRAAASVARERAKIQEKLDADPELREIFMKLRFKDGASKATEHRSEPAWVRCGEPLSPTPHPEDDPRMARLRVEGFEMARKRHEELVSGISFELKSRPALREAFRKTMTDMGLSRLLDEHFPGI